MGGIGFLAIMVVIIIGPVLFATMIADLTKAQVLMMAAAAAAVAGYFAVDNSAVFRRYYWEWTEPAPPAAEAAFIAAADDLRRQRANASGAESAKLRQAESRLCTLPAAAENWVGRVAQIFRADTGQNASLSVEIWPRVVVHTAYFADSSGTLIRGPAPLFSAAASLRAGDTVRFSGQIAGHSAACPGGPAADRDAGLHDPAFLFRFSRIEAAAGQGKRETGSR